ncbi:MAG TPA: SGNH/GDSL hydrolase family protein [Chthonomonadaceae bacterium]|nr:SGNH/GDSL hydrolase family protein [Chthonomonadaceae bacterium]
MKRHSAALLAGLCVLVSLASLGPVAHAAEPHAGNAPSRTRENFYLRDGDRVVFYGDSITDQRLYTTYIESYCVSRFPKKHFTFFHSGWGGDRVTGGGGGPIDLRLKRDVLVYKPNVVTICLGMNDGGYAAFDQARFDTYVNGYRHILTTLLKELPGVRITLLTAPPFDDVTRPVTFPGGYNSTLAAYGEAVKALGREYGLVVADTNEPLVAALARAKTSDAVVAANIIRDRVHPGPGGHIVMAAAVLKAWNAPDTVAEIELDGKTGKVARHNNTHLSDVHVADGKLTFTHLDDALPWPLDRDPKTHPDTELVLASTDIEQTLNRYTLTVTGLSGEKYTVKVDGAEVATVSGADLAKGVDLAALPGLPANTQAQEVLAAVRKHTNLHNHRWRDIQVQMQKGQDGMNVSDAVKKQMDDLDAQEAEALKELQGKLAPKPHTVEIAPAP